MSNTQAKVGREELEDFQVKLKDLSNTLKDYHDTLVRNLSTLNETWDDPKFQQFEESFEANKHRIVDISKRIDEWATINLQRKIDKIIAFENTNNGR